MKSTTVIYNLLKKNLKKKFDQTTDERTDRIPEFNTSHIGRSKKDISDEKTFFLIKIFL